MKWLFKRIFPDYIWDLPTDEKVIYLTFDDGPIPEITPWVLKQLKIYNAQASFFCVGDNIRKFPEVFRQVKLQGHTIGNHTYNHLNGWKTPQSNYLENFKKVEEITNTQYFRPPYGRVSKKQAKEILRTHKIIMWSVLTKDYDTHLSPQKCLDRAIKNTENGSIVLFHDSLKAFKNLEYALPKYLKHFSALGYTFKSLPPF